MNVLFVRYSLLTAYELANILSEYLQVTSDAQPTSQTGPSLLFETYAIFRHSNLQDNTSSLGGAFETNYRSHLASAAARLAPRFPARLFGPNDATFKWTNTTRPEYIVISYTWGRWKLPTRESDWSVEGAHWKVPANRLFSKEDFTKAIRAIAGNMNAWVDVLCIPQDDSDPEMAVEIEKQSEIFRSASRAAVWLCSGGEKDLVEICSLVPEEKHLIPPDTLALVNPNNVAEARRRLKLVARLPETVPWLTSLWTLQEAALRPDAVFYGKSGSPLHHGVSGNPLTIRHIIRTLSQIHELLLILFDPHADAPQGVLDRPELWGMCAQDITLVFDALEAVNRIALHQLANMNASELLLACTHRVTERPHDRVYGIMGAIGVTIPVDYKLDADKVMDMFMVELHNKVPAEMQAFYRSGFASMTNRQWAVEPGIALLSLVRQSLHPEENIFEEVTSSGHLVAREVTYISPKVLDELTSRVLARCLLPALDVQAFLQMLDSTARPAGKAGGVGGSTDVSLANLCLIMRRILSKYHMALIFLGSICGMKGLGWEYMYLLLGSRETPIVTPNGRAHTFQRLGVFILADPLTSGKPTQGRFLVA